MPLPLTRYTLLTDAARDWDAQLFDVVAHAAEGLLQVSVMAIGLRVETGPVESPGDPDRLGPATGEAILNGPQPVHGQDVWPVIGEGVAHLTRLCPDAEGRYRRIPAGEPPLKVMLRDLLLMRTERERFEACHGISGKLPTVEAHPGFSHTPDYASVTLHGTSYALGQRQAAVVRLLHAASRAGDPWIDGEELLTRAGAGSRRLVDLFKTQANWRSLILPDRKGRWRLNIAQPNEGRARAFRRSHLRLVVG